MITYFMNITLYVICLGISYEEYLFLVFMGL